MRKTDTELIDDRRTYADAILENPIATLVFGILTICFGVFFIWINCMGTAPITREEAVQYSGAFAQYKTYKNSLTLTLEDGASYHVTPMWYPLEEKLEELEPGETLWLLVNPDSENTLEIKTASQELLNFEEAQERILSERNGFIGIGVVVCLCGIFLMGFASVTAREAKRAKQQTPAVVPLRPADMTVKCRVLLEARVNGYSVCYRRVKTVNELVIDGQVYAQRKGFWEPAHKLQAKKGGHLIEAGLHSGGYSYIRWNGKNIKRKKRWF